MNLAIVGSRDMTQSTLFNEVMAKYVKNHGLPKCIISGGAKGADAFAKQYAIKNNIPYLEMAPNWRKYGKAAGPMRNTDIIAQAEYVISFPSHFGSGTQDSINKAQDRGIPVEIHWVD